VHRIAVLSIGRVVVNINWRSVCFVLPFGIFHRQSWYRKYAKTVSAYKYWKPVCNCLLW